MASARRSLFFSLIVVVSLLLFFFHVTGFWAGAAGVQRDSPARGRLAAGAGDLYPWAETIAGRRKEHSDREEIAKETEEAGRGGERAAHVLISDAQSGESRREEEGDTRRRKEEETSLVIPSDDEEPPSPAPCNASTCVAGLGYTHRCLQSLKSYPECPGQTALLITGKRTLEIQANALFSLSSFLSLPLSPCLPCFLPSSTVCI
jgi:hypothetical protein